MKARDDISRAAEEEMSRRYQNQLFGTHASGLPRTTPSTTKFPSVDSTVAGDNSRPGTAPDSAPVTRPPSRTNNDLSSDFGLLKDSLMNIKRTGSAASQRSTGGGGAGGGQYLSSLLLQSHDKTISVGGDRSQVSTRPNSAALTVLEFHRAPSSNSGSAGTSFFERSKFRDLYNQLNKQHKKDFVQSTWDETALAKMESMLFQRPSSATTSNAETVAMMSLPPRPHSAADSEKYETGSAYGEGFSNISLELARMHQEIDQHVTREVGGDGVSVRDEPEARLEYFKHQLLNERLKKFPALSHLVQTIMVEYDRYVAHLKRQNLTSEASIVRDTLTDTVKELADAKRKYLESERRNEELKEIANKVTMINNEAVKNQKQLEDYVDELRVTLSSFANMNLRGAPNMRPDTSSKQGFVEAIRRLAKEVDTLREENMRLSDVASSYVSTQERQAVEMNILLEKANSYQHQVGQLKASIRVIKQYVDSLETRVRELRNVHEENETLRTLVPMQVAKYEREHIVPYQLGVTLAQHQLLAVRSVSIVAPQEYQDNPSSLPDEKLMQLVQSRIPFRVSVTQHNLEEAAQEDEDCMDSDDISGGGSQSGGGSGPNGGGSGAGRSSASGGSLAPSSIAPSEFTGPVEVPLPLHLMSRFGKIKLKPMNVNDVRGSLIEIFTEYGNSLANKRNKDPRCIPVPFEQFAKEWTHRRLKSEKGAYEQNMSLFYWSDVYRHRAPEMVMFFKASVGHISGFIFEVVAAFMQQLKQKLQQVESSSKKQKDRVARDVFVNCVRSLLPFLSNAQLEALCVSSIHAQEGRFAEEVAYEPFFDRNSGGGVFMYDALAHAAIAHTELLHLLVEEKFFTLLHERNAEIFEKLQRQRDEMGSTGTVATQQMQIESAASEKCGRAPLRILRDALLEIDPTCPHNLLWFRLAVSTGKADFNRLQSDGDEEDALDEVFDVTLLMKNLRRGISLVISPPLPPKTAEEVQQAADKGEASMMGGSIPHARPARDRQSTTTFVIS